MPKCDVKIHCLRTIIYDAIYGNIRFGKEKYNNYKNHKNVPVRVTPLESKFLILRDFMMCGMLYIAEVIFF